MAQAIASQYTGHARLRRLVFTAKKAAGKGDEALQLEALKLAFEEARKVSASVRFRVLLSNLECFCVKLTPTLHSGRANCIIQGNFVLNRWPMRP